MSNIENSVILAAVDAPDPDNFAQIIALHKLNPGAEVIVMLTGRPVRLDATKDHANWQWDSLSSRMAQEASAARVRNFLRHFDVPLSRVYDGGIAPRTLVQHWKHFQEYHKFLDIDPLAALRYSELQAQEDLIKLLLSLPEKSVKVAVGGPMTGINQLITRCPEIGKRFSEVHAMFATWGEVQLMQFDEAPRENVQFNVDCDPQAAHNVLFGLDCPIYLMPTEVTRVQAIGFLNPKALRAALPKNPGTARLYKLYCHWYDAAVKPRQKKNKDELIFIHDIVAAFSLDPELRKAIYNVVPVEITGVPYLLRDAADWGKVFMKETDKASRIFAATSLTENGAAQYLSALKRVFA